MNPRWTGAKYSFFAERFIRQKKEDFVPGHSAP
jgi:hypothetical protein